MRTTEKLAKIDKAQASLRKAATTAILPGQRETLNDLVEVLDVVREHCIDIENKRTPATRKKAATKK